jgi:ribokinase
MILVFGSVNLDLVAEVEAIPRPGETVLSPAYATAFGGKGANQAVAAARVAGPGHVALVARVGDDAFGRACRENLAANGVDAGALGLAERPTGCAFITVDRRGENAITVASGANLELVAGDVPEPLIAPGTVGVFQMEVPLAASLAVAERLARAGGRVAWNLAPVPAGLARADLDAILAVTRYLVVNAGEAAAALGVLGEAAGTAQASAARLAAVGDLTCIVTDGPRGAHAGVPGGEGWHCPARAVRVVDTTGAGDTFVGVLAAGLAEGRAAAEAVRDACVAASLACEAVGAQAAMPGRAAVRAGRRPPPV